MAFKLKIVAAVTLALMFKFTVGKQFYMIYSLAWIIGEDLIDC